MGFVGFACRRPERRGAVLQQRDNAFQTQESKAIRPEPFRSTRVLGSFRHSRFRNPLTTIVTRRTPLSNFLSGLEFFHPLHKPAKTRTATEP